MAPSLQSLDTYFAKKNEPELWLHFLVTSYDGQGHVYKRKIIRGADLEKTYIWVILYYKIDHFCPLKSNFHTFLAIWPNDWVWNSLLPGCYHLLVQVRLARSLFFPLGTNYWAKSKPRCKKYEGFFGNQGYFWAINQYSITFIGVKKERKGFLHVLLVHTQDSGPNMRIFVIFQLNLSQFIQYLIVSAFQTASKSKMLQLESS